MIGYVLHNIYIIDLKGIVRGMAFLQRGCFCHFFQQGDYHPPLKSSPAYSSIHKNTFLIHPVIGVYSSINAHLI